MRRKITEEAYRAWCDRRPFKKSNTQITVDETNRRRRLFLFGNLIAYDNINGNYCCSGDIYWTMSGWNTVTTRERLKIIGIDIKVKNGIPYLGTERVNPHQLYRLNK